MRRIIFMLVLLFVMVTPVLAAIDMGGVSSADKLTFNQILQPVKKIYNLIKYIATFVACAMAVYAGVIYITSAGEPRRKENAKQMITFVLIGLMVVWATPYVIDLMF